MVDSRQKGYTAELNARNKLRELTKLPWERVPQSGALSENHKLKGDLYIPECKNLFCIEVKHYKDDNLTSKILTGKNPKILEWWIQAESQARKVSKIPLVIFKHDRSKWFVIFNHIKNPKDSYRHLYINKFNLYFAKLEDFIKYEEVIFIEQVII